MSKDRNALDKFENQSDNLNKSICEKGYFIQRLMYEESVIMKIVILRWAQRIRLPKKIKKEPI